MSFAAITSGASGRVGPVVSGGTLTSDSNYFYRRFTGNGTFSVTDGSLSFDYIVVAGGGAGGNPYYSNSGGGGGGGAGGVVVGSTSLSNSSLSIVIGAGGTVTSSTPTNGSNSSFGSISATGGGAAGYSNASNPNGVNPTSGGSGGGGGGSGPSTISGASGTSGQGNSGGICWYSGSHSAENWWINGGGGGGGGAATPGANGATANASSGAAGGNGGNGIQVWTTENYVGGGGGGGHSINYPAPYPIPSGRGLGGLGGGGNGYYQTQYGVYPTYSTDYGPGTVNTGGGGGGDGWYLSNNTTIGGRVSAGPGGSGVVWIRYPKIKPSIVESGLVLHLDAEKTASYPGTGTTWTNLSDTTFSAELVNSPTYNSSNGGFFQFVTDDFARIPNNISLDTQTPSVEVWVKTNSLNQNGFWFEKGTENSQYSLFQEGSLIQWRQRINGNLSNLNTTTSTYMNTSNWYQVVGTYTSGSRKLYINGVLVNSDTASGTIATSDGGMSIGALGGFSGLTRSYFYNGNLAICRVYNKELSASEVLQNFNASRSRFWDII